MLKKVTSFFVKSLEFGRFLHGYLESNLLSLLLNTDLHCAFLDAHGSFHIAVFSRQEVYIPIASAITPLGRVIDASRRLSCRRRGKLICYD